MAGKFKYTKKTQETARWGEHKGREYTRYWYKAQAAGKKSRKAASMTQQQKDKVSTLKLQITDLKRYIGDAATYQYSPESIRFMKQQLSQRQRELRSITG